MMKPLIRDNKNPAVTNPVSLLRNAVVVVVCVAGMGVCLRFFLRDLSTSLQSPDIQPVGTVNEVANDVKRISINRLQWDRLERYSPVYDGDIIISGVLSGLKINFKNGEILELSENTSIRVIYQDSRASRFVLREGEVQAESAEKAFTISLLETVAVEMVDSDLHLDLEPGTRASVSSHNTFALKVYKGSGTFSSRAGPRIIAAGEGLTLGEDGLIRPDPPVIMLAPLNGARILLRSRETAPVEFRWKRLNLSGLDARLEIAKTRDFLHPEGSWSLGDNDSLEVDLSEGSYYWRINTPYSQEAVDSGRFSVVYTQGPLALYPANGAMTVLPPGNSGVRFSWLVPEEAEAVMLEVADNPDITNPRIRQSIKRTQRGRGSYISSELDAGAWYWRVQPVYSGSRIEQDMPENRTSPVNSFTLAKTAGQPVRRERSSPLPDTTGNSIPQLIYPPDNYTLEANRTPDILFSWGNTYSHNARFQMSERSDFIGSFIKNEEVFGSSLQGVSLKPGTYYWRITGAGQGRSSPPYRLVVNPALLRPRLESPPDNEQLRIREGDAVRFSWEPLSYANYYQFCLFLEGRESPLSEISSLQNNSVYVYFDPNTQGRFTWTVQGFGAPTNTSSGRNGLVALGHFRITPSTGFSQTDQISWSIPRIANVQTYAGTVDSSIVLISPLPGANISGIQAIRSPPEARWRSDEPLRNIQLIVSRTTDPASDPRAIVRDVTDYSVTFPALDEGIWYWIIRGDSSELRGVTPGDPSWINVLPIPLLPAPLPLYPINRAIGIEQLTRDRNITFRWSDTDGVNAYIFSLFQDGDPPKLVITAPLQTEVSYVLENLSLLNEGDYLWQVEGVYLDRNGLIEQRGRTEQYPFTIEIQRSSDLQTNSQGVLYGQ